MISSRNLLLSVLACGSVAAIVIACGSDDESKFKDGTSGGPAVFPEAGFGDGTANPSDDLYKNDPPPPWCGPDAGTPLPPITGTEDCPDDKNKPGCACGNVGDTAPCWTGLRKHRNLGVCKDGVAKCVAKNETLNVWGACEGQVLPTPGATGADGCGCFSVGVWNIKNTSPCLRKEGADTFYAYSTVLSGDKATYCGANGDPVAPQGTAPPGIWSTSTLKVDCAGHFKLCFKIRAGDFNNPKADD
jgi:hypothetical protein